MIAANCLSQSAQAEVVMINCLCWEKTVLDAGWGLERLLRCNLDRKLPVLTLKSRIIIICQTACRQKRTKGMQYFSCRQVVTIMIFLLWVRDIIHFYNHSTLAHILTTGA